MRIALFFLLAGCLGAPRAASLPTPDSMDRLARDYWQFLLADSPRDATWIGDHRFDSEIEDISPAAIARVRAEEHRFLDRAAALDPKALSAEDRINRDVLVEHLEADLGAAACHLENWHVDHLEGPQVSWSQLAAQHPVRKAQGVRDLVARYKKMPAYFAQVIADLTAGAKQGWVAPEVNLTRTAAQLDAMIAAPLDHSAFMPKCDDIAKDIGESERRALCEELRGAVEREVHGTLERYRNFIRQDLLPKARKLPGLAGLPFAAPCYAAMIRATLGSAKTPAELHRLGLEEVDRIRAEMKILAERAGFKDAHAYAESLTHDPKQHVKTRDELVAVAKPILARALAAAPKAIGHLPQTPIELSVMEGFREKESPAAYYDEAPDDHSRPAHFMLNTYQAETRPLFTMEALTFHEGVPGHHVQIGIADERKNVPDFRRRSLAPLTSGWWGGDSAFVEGWALYAERLAKELGLYSSDAAEFGRLTFELWRAYRLVIDTGLHAMGWTREQALKALGEGTALSEVDVNNEVDRYITWPAQALAYKVGEIEIRRLRALAEQKLGARFAEREFHDELLRHGAMPLPILSRVMQRWIDVESTASPPR
jgi:uncharacterized protein (DUF885 family)